MKNLYDAAKEFANAQTGEDHPAYADAMSAYYEYALANGVVDLSEYAKTADLALAGASVADNVSTSGSVSDLVTALIAAGLMASA